MSDVLDLNYQRVYRVFRNMEPLFAEYPEEVPPAPMEDPPLPEPDEPNPYDEPEPSDA